MLASDFVTGIICLPVTVHRGPATSGVHGAQ